MYVPLTIETRTHGKKNSWQELRAIVESNENDQKLQKRLRLAGLTPLNNSLMMSVDEGGVGRRGIHAPPRGLGLLEKGPAAVR